MSLPAALFPFVALLKKGTRKGMALQKWGYLRFLRWRNERFVNHVDHGEVVGHVNAGGGTTPRYLFMVAMSCGIAILGLLLSSPAVIIGAMLISPLMGPIISFGFSLAVFDFKQMRSSLASLAVGSGMAVAVAYALVAMSPLTEATPEIIARTRPNLFDLLVAIFSGLAGAYALIRERGETIVGVAIATALMPPLAVVGYGVAEANVAITRGAMFLFMVNLLAIALSATAVAKWYGFGGRHSPRQTVLQGTALLTVFGLLSLPLGVALQQISFETYARRVVQETVGAIFADHHHRLASLALSFPKEGPIRVDAVLMTDGYLPNARREATARLGEKLARPLILSLDQVVLAQEKITAPTPLDSVPAALAPPTSMPISKEAEMAAAITRSALFPLRFVAVDTPAETITVSPEPPKGFALEMIRKYEGQLGERYPQWQVRVIPPSQALPPVFFDSGSDELGEEALDRLGDIVWALERWKAGIVLVVGYASSVGQDRKFDNRSLAMRRADRVGEMLREKGYKVTTASEFLQFRQRQSEVRYGTYRFHRVEVRLEDPSLHEEIMSATSSESSSEEEATPAKTP